MPYPLFMRVSINSELDRWRQAGALRRLLMRSEATVRQELVLQQSRVNSANNALISVKQKFSSLQSERQQASTTLAKAEAAVAGEDREKKTSLSRNTT